MQYLEVLNKVYNGDLSKVPNRLLALDPGNTTGWCLFVNGKLENYGQIDTVIPDTRPGAKADDKVLNWKTLKQLFTGTRPTEVICENYRIYAHKLDRHSFSQVETLRLIGGIDMLCNLEYNIPIGYAMAVQAKGFVTDERLKEWDFWKPGMRHSRDAIRHAIYYLIITNKPKK